MIKLGIIPYHAKCFTYELTKHSSSSNIQKFTATPFNSQVGLILHLVEAALIVTGFPYLNGAIFVDEVQIDKTLRAGFVVSQLWTERKRKILIIIFSNLKRQYNQEFVDKFFLSFISLSLKSRSYALRAI